MRKVGAGNLQMAVGSAYRAGRNTLLSKSSRTIIDA